MTSELEPTGGKEVAPYDPDEEYTGLEDVDESDLVIPRLKILHKEAVFENNLTNERFDVLRAVLLAPIKQRIMWHPKVEDGDVPQCKSTDFDHGIPNISDDPPRKECLFPWAESNFERDQAQPLELASGEEPAYPQGYSSNGHPVLPCARCVLKDWQSNGDPPRCSEMHTYPLLYVTNEGTEDEAWITALFSVQKTGIKPSKAYISNFKQQNKPMFQKITEISLDVRTRAGNQFCVPKFTSVGNTDREDWPGYATRARTLRTFIRLAPRRGDYEDMGDTAEHETKPAAAASAAAPAAKAATAPAAKAAPTPPPDDDLPF